MSIEGLMQKCSRMLFCINNNEQMHSPYAYTTGEKITKIEAYAGSGMQFIYKKEQNICNFYLCISVG
jgi:hypothetical protein